MTHTITQKQYWAYRELIHFARQEARKLDTLEDLIIKTIRLESDDSMHILDAIHTTKDPKIFLDKLGITIEEPEEENK